MFSRPNFQVSIRLTVIGRIAPSTDIFINSYVSYVTYVSYVVV